MKVIDLNIPLIDLGGKVIEGETIGKLLAQTLAASPGTEDTIKFYDWAIKLYNGQPLTLDRSDCEKLKNFVMDSKNITVLGKGQILPFFDTDK